MNYAIIAAGEGSRLVQEGEPQPKPLVKIDGKPMIERLIGIMTRCGATSISVIVNERMSGVADFVRHLASVMTVPVRLHVKSTPSSMHSFHELTALIPHDERFCLTTVDTIFREDEFRRFIEAFEADSRADGYMAVTDYIDDEKPLYVATDSDMRITAFLDNHEEEVRYVSGGIYALGPAAFGVLNSCMEQGMSRMRNFQRALVAAGLNLRAWPMGKIIDVDHRGDIEKAEALLVNDTSPKHS